jgi:predicted lipid-binding transport protein (Tim44 family)
VLQSIGGLSRGALIGIIVGGAVLLLAIIGALLACCIIRKRRQQAELYKQTLPVKAADVPSFHSDGVGYHGSPRVNGSNKMSTAAVPVTADARQK